jgi:hypothetical protein
MSAPLRSSDFESFSAYEADNYYDNQFELSAGDRIGGPVSRANDVIAWCTAIAIIVGGGWVLIHDEGTLLARVPELAARISDAVSPSVPAPKPAPPPSIESTHAGVPYGPPAPEPSQAAAVLPPPLPAATPVAEPPAMKPEPVEASAADDTHDASEPPLQHDRTPPRDAYQARAEAAGLNPGLSRELLKRFSKKDFKNARFAIETAIAKTPDDGVFVWPRQRRPSEALFKVHFVEGGGSDCRRYVVSVMMNNWTTTALPMEKCGVPRVAARALAARDMKKRAAH